MILSALCDCYQRLLEQDTDGISPFGYSQEKISYEVLLTPEGSVVGVNDIRDVTDKKPTPRSLSVPQPEKRTSGIKSNFLWDKTSYVLGISGKGGERTELEHAAFKELHLKALAEENDPGLQALVKFLQSWKPEQFQAPPFNEDMLDSNLVFRLDGHHIQFNVVKAETLRAAQKEPENYKDLIVRVAGYSDYFNDLGEDLQEEIIQRTAHDSYF